MQGLNTQRHATDTDRDGGVGVVRFGTSWKTLCNTVEATECAVSVVAAASIIGCWGLSIEDLGTFHGVIGACLAI